MKQIKGIVFDLDGTLYSNSEFASEIHHAAVRSIANQLDMPLHKAELKLQETKRLLAEQTGREATLSDACADIGADLHAMHKTIARETNPDIYLKEDNNVINLLKRLSEDYSLYIYTNNNRQLSKKIINTLKIAPYFKKIFTIEDYWRSKPDWQALETIFDEIGILPEESIFVGDRFDVDLRLPAEMGCYVFLTKSIDELLTLEQFIKGLN
ncbi:MAG: HAD family hydrolase [Desulfuromonadales bacterium]|nr:HAD family hydrolase [Desulfuromonadales bacterium]